MDTILVCQRRQHERTVHHCWLDFIFEWKQNKKEKKDRREGTRTCAHVDHCFCNVLDILMLRVGTLLAAWWSSWCSPFTASLVSLSVFLSYTLVLLKPCCFNFPVKGYEYFSSTQLNSLFAAFHSHCAFVFVGKCSWAVEKLLFAVRSLRCAATRWPDFGFCQAKRVNSIAAVAAGPWRDDATLSRRAS